MKNLKYLLSAILVLISLFWGGCRFLPSATPAPAAPAGIQVTCLDVGQADSILVQVLGSNMLIDAGTNAAAASLTNTLKNKGITKFDVVVGTHPHEDHIGGLDTVINQFAVEKIFMPGVSATSKTFEDVMQAIKNKGLTITNPVPGTSFNLNSATCAILAPNSPKYEDANSYSIVIRVLYGGFSFLFTGDAQIDSEKEMLDRGYALKSDVLKVGHHGSSTSTSPDFLKAVAPRVAVISVGKDNDYGHPHNETLNKLNAAGIKTYRTDLNGSVIVSSDGGNYTIKTEK
jgi:competence protein ComEC